MGTMVSRSDMHWVAGVLDAKGNFSLRINRITVQSVEFPIVKVLCDLCIGKPHSSGAKNTTFGRYPCTEHCPEPHSHVSFPTTNRFVVTGTSAAIVAYSVQGFMKVRADEAENLWRSVCRNVELTGNRVAAARIACLRMSRKGWKLPPTIRQQIEFVQRGAA